MRADKREAGVSSCFSRIVLRPKSVIPTPTAVKLVRTKDPTTLSNIDPSSRFDSEESVMIWEKRRRGGGEEG